MATVLLWWSYLSVRLQLDSSPIEQILMETVRNERALLVFAILSTIIMVSLSPSHLFFIRICHVYRKIYLSCS